MKNKVIAVLATFGMVATASAIKVNNNLSINGFIDGSYYSQEVGAGADTSNIGLDEIELNILVNAGNVSGELHIDTEDSGDAAPFDTISNDDLTIEQVHFTYSFSNGAALTVGRFGSQLGLEREDPAGLYTFSRAYGVVAGGTDVDDRFNLGNIDSTGAQEGARLSYSTGDIAASLSLYNSADGIEDDGAATNDLDYELALSYTGFDNLTVGAGVQTVRPAGVAADTETYTINATYTLNKLLVGAEYINSEVTGGADLSAYSILGDYDVNDQLGLAIRYSNWETAASQEADKLTFAPNYAITESLGAIVEFSAEEAADGTETGKLLLLKKQTSLPLLLTMLSPKA
jgi:hypothetical protein